MLSKVKINTLLIKSYKKNYKFQRINKDLFQTSQKIDLILEIKNFKKLLKKCQKWDI